jgi:hypothetical protein
MSVPIIFTNISYSVAGSSTYRGDLILTKGMIYYFPHTDVANKRFLLTAIILAVLVGPLLLLSAMYVVIVFAALFLVLILIFFPAFFREAALEAGSKVFKAIIDSGENVDQGHNTPGQEAAHEPPQSVSSAIAPNFYPLILYPVLWYAFILDSAVLVLNENKSLSRHSLPSPIRLPKLKILGIELSSNGLLTVETDFAMKNQFRVGVSSAEALRAALIEAGFISPNP